MKDEQTPQAELKRAYAVELHLPSGPLSVAAHFTPTEIANYAQEFFPHFPGTFQETCQEQAKGLSQPAKRPKTDSKSGSQQGGYSRRESWDINDIYFGI